MQPFYKPGYLPAIEFVENKHAVRPEKRFLV